MLDTKDQDDVFSNQVIESNTVFSVVCIKFFILEHQKSHSEQNITTKSYI